MPRAQKVWTALEDLLDPLAVVPLVLAWQVSLAFPRQLISHSRRIWPLDAMSHCTLYTPDFWPRSHSFEGFFIIRREGGYVARLWCRAIQFWECGTPRNVEEEAWFIEAGDAISESPLLNGPFSNAANLAVLLDLIALPPSLLPQLDSKYEYLLYPPLRVVKVGISTTITLIDYLLLTLDWYIGSSLARALEGSSRESRELPLRNSQISKRKHSLAHQCVSRAFLVQIPT